jgi:signal transduction histidine kinase
MLEPGFPRRQSLVTAVVRPTPWRRCLRCLLVVWLAGAGPAWGQTLTNLPGELGTVAAVRSLPIAQTRQNIPVHLRGVVTFYDERLYSRFLQDDTAGIYLQFPSNIGPPPLLAGEVVEVTGTYSPGEYAPVVVADRVTVGGVAPLPAPKRVTYEELASGVEDSQFVEINGIVRSDRWLEDAQYHLIEIAAGGGRVLVYAKQLPVADPADLLDSTVRVRGVCSVQFNHQRQLFAIRLMVPRPDDLAIVTPATANPFSAQTRPIGSLLQFAPQATYGHRVKVAGTVIYYDPGTAFFLEDGGHGVEVETKGMAPLEMGEQVEALGFISQGVYTPRLQDAVYRKIGGHQPVRPLPVTVDEALAGNYDCQLIQLSARLLDRALHGPEQYLILQVSNFVFQASLKQAGGLDNFARLENGSRVAVTGVCRIEPGEWTAGESWRAKSFSILLRSPDDVLLLAAPPWWTLKRVLWFSGGLALATLLAFGWVMVLHRQVAERTRELEIQSRRRQLAERRRDIEQERARLAQDLHDDLGSRLTEVNMLAALVKSPTTNAEEKARYLADLSETARHMVSSLDEIVWAVNPRNDTIASLASYFGSYAQRFLDIAAISCGLEIAEDLPEHSLDPKFRQELFYAFKEALTNVVRHARATQVCLRISVQDGHLLVALADNGVGLPPRTGQAGDDGLANMRSRLRSLGGSCDILGAPQQGTTVQFRAPLPQKLL